MIDPNTNTVATTINLTSFDEDPRPPFRLATGGVTPTHAAMVTKPLYHGAINIHGATPSPDNKLLACTGRGTSNVYLIDLETMKVIGNTPNSQAGDQTNAERLTSGVLVGREPRTDVRCEVDFTHHRIRFFALRRRDPDRHPLLRESPYHRPNKPFQGQP